MLKLEATLPLDEGADDPPSAAFGSTEKSPDHGSPSVPAEAKEAPTAVLSIDTAFAACRAVGGGHGVFGNAWTERLLEVVQPAYGLFCLTHDKPAELARLARLAEIRFTDATEKNPALLCIKLAARPKDTDQDKICSDWSTLLRCALPQNIAPDGFIAWVKTTTVRGCKAAIAQEKAAARVKAGQPPRKRNQLPRDGARADGVSKSGGELVEMLASIQTAVLDALTAPGSDAEQRERVIASLRGFADSLASGGMIEGGSGSNGAAREAVADA